MNMLNVSSSPHVRDNSSTRRIMLVYSIIAGMYFRNC